ncbi:hypothetical protein [Streptomyces sp. NPDC058272]|uniref:hypothetical protein n=1 Tax=Streptomyces sp. NPDC058272 TaxID=3346415 RepID=UPI0036E3EFCA
MRLSKHLTAGAALITLATLSGCWSDSEGGAKAPAGQSQEGTGGQEKADGTGLPGVKTLGGAQEFLSGAGLPCADITTDENAHGTPAQGFLGTTYDGATEEEKRDAAAWKIKESGFCGDTNSELGGWVVYLPSDMKAFQRNYRDKVRASAQRSGTKGNLLTGRFFFGADFVVDPTNSLRNSGLAETGLLIENCDPDLEVPTGYRKQDSLVEGCVLTNYIPS